MSAHRAVIFAIAQLSCFVEDDDAAGDVAGSSELANCSYKGDSDPFKKRMALSDFSILKVLGKGSFGKVCHLIQLMLHFHYLNSLFSIVHMSRK